MSNHLRDKSIAEPWFGREGRIGLICVDSSRVIEGEFWAMVPAGVSIHSTRIYLPRVTVEGLNEMRVSEELEKCTQLLAGVRPGSIIYGGTSVSFLEGSATDQGLIERMANISNGIPCTTTTTAVVRALRTLGLKRIAVATPYNDEINDRLAGYFNAAGFEIVSMKGERIEDPWEICERTPETIFSHVKSADVAEADGVFVSCADYRVGPVTDALEKELGKPVIGAIQASYWDAKRLAGIQTQTEGWGSLVWEY
jgi:maleate isomerase